MMAGLMRLGRCRTGISAVELALVLPLFFAVLLGIINVSLVLWTQASLYFAVQAAARCAAVNPTTCGSDSATQAYAASQYYGQVVDGISPPFGPPVQQDCGRRVSVSYNYPLFIPFYEASPLILSATACFPAQTG